MNAALRKTPIIATIVVVLAILTMIALGIWQLGRADEKDAMVARYQTVSSDGEPIPYPLDDAGLEENLYRKVSATCISVESKRGTAGTNAVGVKGWSQIAKCTLGRGPVAEVALGWSRAPGAPDWDGGVVIGILAPGGKIVAGPPLADLGPLAKPDPADLPNNHMAYAVQWFLFALTALVMYIIALRVRARKG